MYEKQCNNRRKGRDLSREISVYKSETLPLKASSTVTPCSFADTYQHFSKTLSYIRSPRLIHTRFTLFLQISSCTQESDVKYIKVSLLHYKRNPHFGKARVFGDVKEGRQTVADVSKYTVSLYSGSSNSKRFFETSPDLISLKTESSAT